MANVKISELPQVSTLATTDVLPSVASSVTSKITLKSLANTMPQVTSSISASYSLTASYALNAGGATFPYVGIAQITGSLILSGSYNQGKNNYIDPSADNAFAQGFDNEVYYEYGFAQGRENTVQGIGGHAEGYRSDATAQFYSHAEGNNTTAGGNYSHTEGASTTTDINAESSHAEGYLTQTKAQYSHTEGYGTETSPTAEASHAEGYYTVASGSYQHVQGRYNLGSTAQSAFIIGNGISNASRSNLVFASGSTFQITGSLNISGSTNGVVVNSGYVVLTQVSRSLNYLNDTAAASGGVPLGGLYRSGSFILIRLV
jgi:hypothetical protein